MTHDSLNSANQTLQSVGNTDWITMDTVKDCDVETIKKHMIWASKIYKTHQFNILFGSLPWYKP